MKLIKAIPPYSLLSISIGIVYLCFGILKFFPDLSPAEDLAKITASKLTLGFIPPNVSLILLAIWETLIGVLLLTTLWKRIAITLALIHITLAFTPFFLFPELTFNGSFIAPTLLGQYIAKNIIIISTLLALRFDLKKDTSY